MSGSSKATRQNAKAPVSRISQARKVNHLKDEVYREMLLLEMNRPGAEMGLALALLRAIVHSESLREQDEFEQWLASVCPLGLQMIEASLGEGSKCNRSAIAGAGGAVCKANCSNADYTEGEAPLRCELNLSKHRRSSRKTLP